MAEQEVPEHEVHGVTDQPVATLASSDRVRGWRARLGLGGQTLAVLVLTMLAIAAAARADLRLDASADARFSLDPVLVDLASTLAEEVSLVALWSRRDDGRGEAALGRWLDERLKRLAASAPKLRLQHIDAILDQPEIERFAQEHGEAVAPSLYVLREGRRPFRIPLTGALPFTWQRDLGGALVAVTSSTQTPVYVFQGHGELTLDGGDAHGLSALLHRLELAGFARATRLGPAELSRWGRVPGDGILLIPGPTAPLGEEAVRALDAYLRDGGAAMILADHRCPDDLALLLRRWGLIIARGQVANLAELGSDLPSRGEVPVVHHVDASQRGPDRRFTRLLLGPGQGLASGVGPNPLTDQVAASRRTVISPDSTPLAWLTSDLLDDESVAKRISAFDLHLPRQVLPALDITVDGRVSWLAASTAAPDQAPPDQPTGRLPLAAGFTWSPHPRSANPDRGARVLLWGSRAAAADRWLGDPLYANDLLLADAAAWLADRGASVPIARQDFRRYQVDISDGGLDLLMILLVAVIPCLCIGAAIITWWERR